MDSITPPGFQEEISNFLQVLALLINLNFYIFDLTYALYKKLQIGHISHVPYFNFTGKSLI